MMEIWIVCAMAFFLLGCMATVAQVGKPRKAVTPELAVGTLFVNAIIVITGLWVLWGQR